MRFHSRDQRLCNIVGTKKNIDTKKDLNSYGICLEHQYGRRDVMCKHSIKIVIFCTVCHKLLEIVDLNLTFTVCLKHSFKPFKWLIFWCGLFSY